MARHNYDTDVVTLGDGMISVDGMLVSGSRQFARDPRLHVVTDAEEARLYREACKPHMQPPRPDEKWCSGVDKEGCGWRHRAMFARDPTRNDGKDVLCKDCRNKLARQRYARDREAQGHTVYPYKR